MAKTFFLFVVELQIVTAPASNQSFRRGLQKTETKGPWLMTNVNQNVDLCVEKIDDFNEMNIDQRLSGHNTILGERVKTCLEKLRGHI